MSPRVQKNLSQKSFGLIFRCLQVCDPHEKRAKSENLAVLSLKFIKLKAPQGPLSVFCFCIGIVDARLLLEASVQVGISHSSSATHHSKYPGSGPDDDRPLHC